jgi:hypothetical protein
MANLERLKRKNRLGAPPAPEEASSNIFAPEVAPAPTTPTVDETITGEHADEATTSVVSIRPKHRQTKEQLIDGRSLRKTGRTVSFATRVSPAFHQKLRRIAQRDNKLIVEVLEAALNAYEATRR